MAGFGAGSSPDEDRPTVWLYVRNRRDEVDGTPVVPIDFAMLPFTIGGAGSRCWWGSNLRSPRTLGAHSCRQGAQYLIVCGAMCNYLHMATNLAIDPDLIERTLELSGEKTKKAAVTKALEEFIARREQRALLGLFGKLDWDPAYDYKAERSRK